MSAEPRQWTTYRRTDGELIMNEYGWVADTEFFEDDDEDYVEVIEETWQLIGTRTIKFGRLDRWCEKCDEEVTLTEPTNEPVICEQCRKEEPE